MSNTASQESGRDLSLVKQSSNRKRHWKKYKDLDEREKQRLDDIAAMKDHYKNVYALN